MYRKILLYSLPVYMYGLELLLRAIASVTSESVAGPTLAGAGIGFLLPLTALKEVQVDPKLLPELKRINARAYSERDKSLTDFIWLMFFLSLAAWMYAIYLTIRHQSAAHLINWPLAIGCIIFLVSIVLTEFKERI